MQRRHLLASIGLAALARPAFAHHGWSSFDQDRPIYLEGVAESVAWRNPHAEVMLRVAPDLRLPADLSRRPLPAQSAAVDGVKLLTAARLPTRRDAVWEIELAPLTRMEAWQVAEIKPGTRMAVVGFTFGGEKGDAVVRAEYLFTGDKTYGLRSSPA